METNNDITACFHTSSIPLPKMVLVEPFFLDAPILVIFCILQQALNGGCKSTIDGTSFGKWL